MASSKLLGKRHFSNRIHLVHCDKRYSAIHLFHDAGMKSLTSSQYMVLLLSRENNAPVLSIVFTKDQPSVRVTSPKRIDRNLCDDAFSFSEATNENVGIP